MCRSILFVAALLPALSFLVSRPVYGQAHHERSAVHGMLLFGDKHLYASHLPMFHAPHDYQVLLALSIDSTQMVEFQRRRHGRSANATFTLAPEKFVLPQMLASPRPFKALIYEGHFERGGQPLGDSVTVNIKSVLYQKKLNPASRRDQYLQYILVGDKDALFAVHAISAPADFDHVMEVRALDGWNPPQVEIVKVANAGNTVPNVGGNKLQVTSGTAAYEIMVLHQLYLEFDDLKSR